MVAERLRESIHWVTPSTPRSPSHPPGGKGTPPPGRSWAALVVLAAGWLVAAPAFACPVCYGQAEGSIIDGAKLSVIFLGALVYLLIGGGIALAVFAHRRAVKKNLDPRLDPHRGLRLLPPERG